MPSDAVSASASKRVDTGASTLHDACVVRESARDTHTVDDHMMSIL